MIHGELLFGLMDSGLVHDAIPLVNAAARGALKNLIAPSKAP